ncbi:ABC transporter substrate-binding protein, partial [Thioclava sp. BHET1]
MPTRLIKPLLAASAMLLLSTFAAQATTYPLTVTDLAGRKVEIPVEPQRVVLQDGRDAQMLALLDRSDPFGRVKLWNNLLKRQDAPSWEVMRKAWPEAAKIPDMGFGDDGQVNTEEMLAVHPQLVIAEARARASMQQAGVMAQLKALHIPVVFVDTFDKPVPDAVQSVALLGKVLNREAEAKAYGDFYQRHL